MTAALEIRHLSVSYGAIEALRDVTLAIQTGAIVAVIGPNGAGKTTMLQAAMGLLPATGAVWFFGNDISDADTETRVERGLSLVAESRELFGTLSVTDNLTLGAFARAPSTAKLRDDLAAVYNLFPRLAERRGQLAATLSGGERQMLALGRALMGKPRVLMLDEPSLGLAPLVVQEIFRMITGLRKTGVSILLIEQNARAALNIADYGYVLENGALVVEGEARDLALNPRVIESYLGLARAQPLAGGVR